MEVGSAVFPGKDLVVILKFCLGFLGFKFNSNKKLTFALVVMFPELKYHQDH